MSRLFASPAGKNTSSLFIRDSVIWVDIAGICIPCRLMVISTFVSNKIIKEEKIMRKFLIFPLMLLAFISLAVCSPADSEPFDLEIPEQPENPVENGDDNNNSNSSDNMEKKTIRLTVNGRSFTATLVESSSSEALVKRLAQGDVTVRMNDYGDMEKVGSLGFSLPRNDARTTTGPGDLILYQGNSFVIYYDTNSWSFTRLGKVDGVTSREQMLELLGGKGEITVTLSL